MKITPDYGYDAVPKDLLFTTEFQPSDEDTQATLVIWITDSYFSSSRGWFELSDINSPLRIYSATLTDLLGMAWYEPAKEKITVESTAVTGEFTTGTAGSDYQYDFCRRAITDWS